MQILEVAFTCYAVTDMPRAREFYEKTLGLKPAVVYGDGKAMGWVEYEIGPHTLSIGLAEGWKPSTDGASVALEVADFDAVIKDLKTKNVKFAMEPMESPVCRMAFICDPDGSKICIHKRNPVKATKME